MRSCHFVAGQRACIGLNFAMLEAKVVMAIMSKKFRFSMSRKYRHAPVAFVTVRPQHGIPIVVDKIECNGGD
ncbi:hypothetical protein SUGI_0409110 [Cryptomeria japonica]|nr:hypothetical protein SUGI_0409110 [Cryptomeria japonica]